MGIKAFLHGVSLGDITGYILFLMKFEIYYRIKYLCCFHSWSSWPKNSPELTDKELPGPSVQLLRVLRWFFAAATQGIMQRTPVSPSFSSEGSTDC